MPHFSETYCGTCDQRTDPLRLYVKRVQFVQYRKVSSVLRTRVKEYICSTCLEKDVDWNLPSHSGPGHVSQAQKRIAERRDGDGGR